MKSILVSTGANKNDDVFLKDEIINSYQTPINKAVDWEHKTKYTIGAIYDSVLVANGEEISPEDAKNYDGRLDIMDYSVVWKHRYPEEAKSIIKASQDDSLGVSMECYFLDYNYLVGQDIVARNEDTSFLDDYLRCFGGNGTIVDKGQIKTVKRIPRHILFSGKGVVGRPANKSSVIVSVASDTPKQSDMKGTPGTKINDLPDAAFASIDPGGEKDEEGKTVPRSLRHLPHHTDQVEDGSENTTIDLGRLRNALARFSQTKFATPESKERARAHLEKHAKALNIGDRSSSSDNLVAVAQMAYIDLDIENNDYINLINQNKIGSMNQNGSVDLIKGSTTIYLSDPRFKVLSNDKEVYKDMGTKKDNKAEEIVAAESKEELVDNPEKEETKIVAEEKTNDKEEEVSTKSDVDINSALAEMVAEASELRSENEKLQETIDVLNNKVSDLEATIVEKDKEIEVFAKELASIKNEHRTSERLLSLKDKGYGSELIVKLEDSARKMDDEEWSKYIEAIDLSRNDAKNNSEPEKKAEEEHNTIEAKETETAQAAEAAIFEQEGEIDSEIETKVSEKTEASESIGIFEQGFNEVLHIG